MKSEIDANISALEIHDTVLDNSVNIINSSIVNINSSIGKITSDLRTHKLDCDASLAEFSETWAAALVDIRKDIDDLKKRL